MENNENKGFSYTYSAAEQDEIKKIRAKYAKKDNSAEDKMARLRRLDNSVTQRAEAVSLVFGIVGTLILGFGMSLAMSQLSEILGSNKDLAMLIGVIIGVIGGVVASLAYPIYNLLIKRGRAKIAPEVIKLTDELMK